MNDEAGWTLQTTRTPYRQKYLSTQPWGFVVYHGNKRKHDWDNWYPPQR